MKKLKKSKNKIICGVCAGIANYFNLDPTLIRLLIVLLTVLTGGAVIIFYIVAAVLMPDSNSDETYENIRNANMYESAHTENESCRSDEEFNRYFKK